MRKLLISLLALITCLAGAVQPLTGIGCNWHEESRIPWAKLQAIGVSYLRLELNAERFTDAGIAQRLGIAGPAHTLWLLQQSDGDVKAATEKLVKAGVLYIEFWNEAKLAGVSPVEYAKQYNICRLVAGPKVRVYTSLSTFTEAEQVWFRDCLKQGLQLDVLGFHGYLTSPELLPVWVKHAKAYGRPVAITEVGFPETLGGQPYRRTFGGTVAELFVRLKKAMAGIASWCFFDGPNPPGCEGTGLFDSSDGMATWQVPNINYWQVAELLRPKKVAAASN